ncbi:MAG: potassium transporter, partial [Enterovibrio sp.]
HSALELGTQALRSLDVHPFLAEQQKAKLLAIEKKNTQQLYQSWKESEENHNYINLFLQVEQSIYHAMETDRLDRHSMTEREWTPPPKEFLEDVNKEN